MGSITTPSALHSSGKQSSKFGKYKISIFTQALTNKKIAPCLKQKCTTYFRKPQQDPILQEMIENITPDQILRCPTRLVWKWVTNSKNHIQAHHKANQLRAKLHTQDIGQFFPCIPQPPSSNTADKNLL